MPPHPLDVAHIVESVLEHLDDSQLSCDSALSADTLKTEIAHVRSRQTALRQCALVCRAWRPLAQAALLRVLLFDARSVGPNPRIAATAERLQAASAHGRVERIVVPGAALVHLEAIRPIVERCDRLSAMVISTSGDYLPPPASVRVLWIGVPKRDDFIRLTTLRLLRTAYLGDHRGGSGGFGGFKADDLAPSAVRSLWVDLNWSLSPAFEAVLPALGQLEYLGIELGQLGDLGAWRLGIRLRDTATLPRLRTIERTIDGQSVANDGPATFRNGLNRLRPGSAGDM